MSFLISRAPLRGGFRIIAWKAINSQLTTLRQNAPEISELHLSFQIQGCSWSISRVLANYFDSFFLSSHDCHFFLTLTPGSTHWERDFWLTWLLASLVGNMGFYCLWIWKNYYFALVLDMKLPRREGSSLIMCAWPCRDLKTHFFDTSLPYLLAPRTFSQVTVCGSRRQAEWHTQGCPSSVLWYSLYIRPLHLLALLHSCFIKDIFGGMDVNSSPYWFVN